MGCNPLDSMGSRLSIAKFDHVAARYIEEIRQVQPHGPYMLGGYCLGGTLALEMARQLIESGESIGLLALIEIYNIRSINGHNRFICVLLIASFSILIFICKIFWLPKAPVSCNFLRINSGWNLAA